MKQLLYIIIAGPLFCSCIVKKVANNVHAYRQTVLQGANPGRIANEQGKPVEQTVNERANFFIYVEVPSANTLVKELWIKGKPYTAKTETVASTPVVMRTMIGPNTKPDTLVRATSNTVLLITPGQPGDARELPASLKKKIESNELVLHCVVDGQDRYYTQAAIKNLPPLALQ